MWEQRGGKLRWEKDKSVSRKRRTEMRKKEESDVELYFHANDHIERWGWGMFGEKGSGRGFEDLVSNRFREVGGSSIF